MMTTLMTVQVLLSLALFGSLVLVQPLTWAMGEVDWDTLNLTNTQKDKLDNLDAQWQSEMNQVLPRLRSNETRRDQLIKSKDPNQQEIMELTKRILEDKTRLKMDATKHFLKKREVLNPNQEDRLLKMIKY